MTCEVALWCALMLLASFLQEKRPFFGNRDPIGGAVATNCVAFPAGASVMAPPEVQSTDPAAALQHPDDHAGSPVSRSRARVRALCPSYDSTAIQQISLPNVVEGFLERQRSFSIHLSRRMRPRMQRSDSMLEALS